MESTIANDLVVVRIGINDFWIAKPQVTITVWDAPAILKIIYLYGAKLWKSKWKRVTRVLYISFRYSENQQFEVLDDQTFMAFSEHKLLRRLSIAAQHDYPLWNQTVDKFATVPSNSDQPSYIIYSKDNEVNFTLNILIFISFSDYCPTDDLFCIIFHVFFNQLERSTPVLVLCLFQFNWLCYRHQWQKQSNMRQVGRQNCRQPMSTNHSKCQNYERWCYDCWWFIEKFQQLESFCLRRGMWNQANFEQRVSH